MEKNPAGKYRSQRYKSWDQIKKALNKTFQEESTTTA